MKVKKFATKLIALILCLSIINIPVFPVQADVGLISVEEDFTKYSSLADVPNLEFKGNDHTTLTLDPEKGLVMTQVGTTSLVDGKTNTKKSLEIGHVIEGKFNEDAQKRTAYRIDRYSGKYKITVDFEVIATKYTEPVEGVTVTNPYYLWNFGGAANAEAALTTKEKLSLRTYSTSAVAYSAGSTKLETANTVRYTEGEKHQLVIDVDTATKAVTANIDGYKTPAAGSLAKDGYLNFIYVAAMERMIAGSHFSIKNIKIEQTEADAATTAALETLDSIEAPAAEPFNVTGNVTLGNYENVTWTTSDNAVIDTEGNVTRGEEDKEVTLTATYEKDDVIILKDFTLTVKEEVAPPEQVGGLITVEEDFTKYSSLADVPNLKFNENDHTTLTLDPEKGLVMTQVGTTSLVDGKTNTKKSLEIGHIIEGKFNESTAERTFYSIDKYSGKYKITVDFEAIATKYTEPVEGVTVSNPYYLFNLGGVETAEAALTAKEKLSLRINSGATVAYSSGTTKFEKAHTVRYTEDVPHQLVIDVDTATKAVTANVDNYKIPAEGNLAKDGYLNSIYVAGMERMIVGSNFSIKKIKIEQTEADVETAAALETLNSIEAPATDPLNVTDNVALGNYENVTWTTSDEAVIDEKGNVTRGEEDKDVTITATYKNDDVVISKSFVLTVKAVENDGGDEPGTDVPPVQAEGLIAVEEDFTKYSSLADVPNLKFNENDHTTLTLDPEKGLVMTQVGTTSLVDGKTNTKKSLEIGHVIEGKFNEDAQKRTAYRIDRYSGKYKITVDFEVIATKYTEPVEGVTLSNPYYLWNFGGAANAEAALTTKEKLSLRTYSTSAVAYSSGSSKFETANTVRYTEGEKHQLVIDVDTATKAVTANIDGYKTPAAGSLAKEGYLNFIYVAAMERMIVGSYFSINNIKIEQTEADAETTAALETLDAIGDLVSDPYAVKENITLPTYDNVKWSTSDNSVITEKGNVIRTNVDKEVTLTATYQKGDLVINKDYNLTVKAYTDDEFAQVDVEAINLKLGEVVTNSITLPKTGANGTVFEWTSSNPDVVSNSGKVTQAEEDTTVTLTVVGKYGENGSFTRTITFIVAKKGTAGDNPVYGDLIYIEEDYTKYSSKEEVPYFECEKTEHSTVEFVEGKGLVVTQTRSTPVLKDGEEGVMNKEQTPNISHVLEGNFNYDEHNRTAYRLGRFDGKYKLIIEYEVYSPAYPDNEYEGVTISRPYFTFSLGSVPEPASLTTAIQEAVFMRVYSSSATAYTTTSTGSFGACKYTEGENHVMEFEFDTLTRNASMNVDNGKNIRSGFLGKPGFINAFALFGMERMIPGSYFILKKIGAQQLEENENTTKALNALAELPTSLVENPYAVTGDITLPTDNPKITWSSSDTSLITNTGKVNRWYADREVILTATYTEYDTVISKEYTLTVKALDSYDTSVLMSKAGTELEFVETLGDTTKASTTVSDKGINVVKTVGENNGDVEDMPVYFADFRLLSEITPYNEATKSSVSSAGYAGIYDFSFDITPDVSGKKPVNIVLGNKADVFGEIIALAVNSDGIYVVNKGNLNKILEESTKGKTYNVNFKVDTEQKRVWIYVNGVLADKFFEFDRKIEVIDTLRTVVDENNGAGDGVTINNINVTEIFEEIVPVKKQLVDALGRVSVEAVTASPNAVESLKDLPENAGNYKITWVSNSDLIDVENGIVYHGENGETVVVSAIVSEGGICAKKDFYLYVRKASSSAELVEYYLGDLADVVTKQNAADIRYDITLPLEHKGLAISWSSSKPEIIDGKGHINKNAEITKPTDVALTASATIDGSTHSRNYTYTVSPRAYEVVVYEGNGAPASITAGGVENVAVAGTVTTNIKVKQAGNGTITLLDSEGKEIINVNISDSLYNIDYGYGKTVDYPISADTTVSLDVVTMPDIDRVAIFADGVLIADYVEALNEISDISSITVVGGIEVVSTKITTDEYGLLDINVANAGYFDAFEYNVVKGDVAIVNDVIFPADVKWASTDSSLLNVESGKVNTPKQYKFVDVTLTLTSKEHPSVKRVITRKIAVACDKKFNLVNGAKVSADVTPKTGYEISYVADGKFDTAFATSYAKRNPKFTVDFGKETYVNTLYINESGNSIKNYTVAYSNDNKNWTTVKNGTFTGIDSSVVSFDSVYARYISFTVTESLKNDLYVNEIEAYLFAEASELAKLAVEQIVLNTGYDVTGDIELPKEGHFGTTFKWTSNNESVIDGDGKYTQPENDTTVVLTVTGTNDGKTYTKAFSLFVSGKKVPGNKPVGGGGSGGGGAGGGASAPSQIPGFVQTDIKKDEPVVEPEVTVKDFADLSNNHWAYENVMKLKELGIIDGVGDNKFNPSGIVTREQFLKMLVEATGIEVKDTKAAFADVDAKAWYAPYVAAGVDAGLINGITADTFGVGSEIKRQDMAVMIVRILEGKNIPVTETSETFDDDSNISDYAKNAVYKVRDAGIIKGYDNNTFAPSASLTRAEAATVIIKLLDMLQ